MYKHLPGRHNQKTHGHGTIVDDVNFLRSKWGMGLRDAAEFAKSWRGYALTGSIEDFVQEGIAAIPNVKYFNVGTNSGTQLNFGLDLNPKGPELVDDISLRVNGSWLYVDTLYSNTPNAKDPWDFLGPKKSKQLLDGVEKLAKETGFKSIASTTAEIPILLAEKNGYVLHSELTSLSPYKYLELVYDLPIPKNILGDIMPTGTTITDVLKRSHALFPEVPLYLEYLHMTPWNEPADKNGKSLGVWLGAVIRKDLS